MADGLVLQGEIETDLSAEVRRRAARTVASVATDARECAELLSMLGLAPNEGAAERAA
ncbi:hypothetical protein [Actinokineospora spheciospongiae]|uniref:hypothetical protein n=1 Tax=Actinokineospora spheciospongiae TaxID=909613 RepID=UPI000D9B841B|nr:hypothetical protein [Actinokineospora spheciospongiae]PWW61801.1 hypothetical protein DFQ13_10647 [Actinokineospora spheciospongiae]